MNSPGTRVDSTENTDERVVMKVTTPEGRYLKTMDVANRICDDTAFARDGGRSLRCNGATRDYETRRVQVAGYRAPSVGRRASG